MERGEFEGLKPALEGFCAALRQGSVGGKAPKGVAAQSAALAGAARGGPGAPPPWNFWPRQAR